MEYTTKVFVARAAHEVEIHAPPEDVWRALAGPDWTSRWYHGARVVIASQ